MKKAPHILCYILSAALITAYVAILIRAAKPEVSDTYRQYYIERSMAGRAGVVRA